MTGIKVGDKVKINFVSLKEDKIGKSTYEVLKANPDVEFTVLDIESARLYPIKINAKELLNNSSVQDIFQEYELILIDDAEKAVKKVEIKEGLQVKLNHEVLEKRIRELKLEFVGHLKLNPDHVYSVLKKQKHSSIIPVGYIHKSRVLIEYLLEDEVIVVNGGQL